MKKMITIIIVFCFIFTLISTSTVFASPALEEIQTNIFRPHGGDKEEISNTMKAFVKNIKDTKEIKKMLTNDSNAIAALEIYIKELSQYSKIEILSTTVDKLYTVSRYDVFNNFRAIAKVKILCYTSDNKVIEKTDYLGLAKLGKNVDDWKIWGVIWKDSGVDVSDVKLIQLDKPLKGEEICVMTTDAGVIKMRLFPEKAPLAVRNFKALANDLYYKDMPFLRVYENFMIQNGALDGSGKESESSFGGFFEDEFNKDLFNFRGALCLGNNGPNTNGNQFYIVQSPIVDQEYLDLSALPLNAEAKYKEIGGRAYLDFRYTVFGQVFEGIEVVDKIAAQKTDDDGKPLKNPFKILKIEFKKY